MSETGAIELCSAIRGASLMTPEPFRKDVFKMLDQLEARIQDTITTVCPDNDSQWSTLDGCHVARRAIAARL